MEENDKTKDQLREDLEKARTRISELEFLAEKSKRIKVELGIAKEEAEEASKLKDKFIALVSHDLIAPLTSMIGFLRLIRDHSNKVSFTDRKEELLDKAIQSGERMTSYIRDLLNIGKLKTGKVTPIFSFHDASLMAENIAKEFEPLAEDKNIKIINRIPERTRIYADKILLPEVIKNLVSNAIKFSREGGQIVLSVPEGRPSTLAVSDTGVGISPKRKAALFKYEEQTSTRGTIGEKGSGLGLPLSRDLMEAHCGSLTLESELEKGSTFFAELPHIRPVVLVVDDDENARELVALCIKNLDIEIIGVESGEKAIEKISRFLPHLVILDLLMPGMDGFAILRFLKRDHRTSSIPVIMMTANRDVKTKDKAFLMGADDFVAKPILFEDLYPRVKRFVG